MPEIGVVSTASTGWLRVATLEDAIAHGLREEEYASLIEVLGRDLNLVEIGICAALFSEHCSYKSTRVHLKTLPTDGPHVIHGPGENAGVIDVGDGQAVVFKVESHNHPTFIEPFQGAATGVGGILRDVFTMGARPLALMNALRFGEKSDSRTSYLLSRAVAGIGGYGNCMGVPTVGGELFFHRAYNGNCLVNAFALGLVDQDAIFLGKASGVGNPIFYVGSKTGRDGIHGATMASEAFDENSEEKRPTVQVGDPFQEKLLLEACLEAMQTGAVEGIQDMGAAGMTSSTYEMADRAGTGVRIFLDRVPQREEGMNPYEIMLSESQERMVLVIQAGREKEIQEIFKRWELDAVQIGEVVEGKDVELFWYDDCISSMPVSVLTSSAPQYRWPEEIPSDYDLRNTFDINSLEEPEDVSSIWKDFLGDVNVCSRKPVFDQYDSTVRTNTVVHPGGDAAVVRIKNLKNGVEKGIAMTIDCNSRYCAIDPRAGTALSVAESCRNITAVGATPLAISDCLNFASPERPEGMWEIAESIRGLGDAARAFKTPIISGNVSLYNETKGRGILPTPMIAMVGIIEDSRRCVGAHFTGEGCEVFVIGQTRENDIGGSEYLASQFSIEKGMLPVLDYDLELMTGDLIRSLIDCELLLSCHDVSSGGLAVALAESCCSDSFVIGAELVALQSVQRKDLFLFSESGGRYIVSCSAENAQEVRSRIRTADIPLTAEGRTGGSRISIEGVASISIEDAMNERQAGLASLI